MTVASIETKLDKKKSSSLVETKKPNRYKEMTLEELGYMGQGM